MTSLDSFDTRGTLRVGDRSLAVQRIERIAPADLPYSLKIVLENLLRHEDGDRVTSDQVRAVPVSSANVLIPSRIRSR